MLNVISNKVVAKIYTDLQVSTIYQIGICNFWCLQEAVWLLNHARSVLTLNPELNAQSTIILIDIENLLPTIPLHFMPTTERNMWMSVERRKTVIVI